MSKNNKPILDIALITAGRSDLFERCVDAILPQMKDIYKIHVINNGHPSAHYEEIYKKLPEGSVIKRSNQNSGFGGGANSVIKSGSAPLVLFISDDIFIHEGVIDRLIRVMDDPTIGMSGYKFLFPKDSTDPNRPAGKVQHIGLGISVKGEVIHPCMGWSADNPKCNISRDVPAVTGASFIVRRSVFNKAGGFNPVYGKGYYEDVDLCMTITSLGFRVYIDTVSVAEHGVGQTFATVEDKSTIPMQQNRQIFQNRWLGQLQWSDWTFW
jgi:GT2 family glycosyltransferase